VRRREFITLVGGGVAAWPLVVHAQQPAKGMLRVGTVSAVQQSSPQWVNFMRRMAELGYQEGKTFDFDFVQTDDYESGYRILAEHKPDIILATGPEIALKSALAASRTLPIVMIAIDYDPFARGYVTSLARPSGNVTGVFFSRPSYRRNVFSSSEMRFRTPRPRSRSVRSGPARYAGSVF
jgi:putative ABC transport system substrate-binding protein